VEPKLQRRIQRYGWDKAADFYERFWADQLRPATELLLAAAQLQPGEHVLDVACGGGAVTFPAARAVGATGRVLGTDISAKMIAAAGSSPERAGLDHVEFTTAGAEDLQTDDESFDVALCALGLMYVPSPSDALAEMRRSLRSTGRIVVSVWGERRSCGWAEIFPIIDSRVASDVCPMFFFLGVPGALEAALDQAGFAQVESTRLDIDIEYRSEEEALGAAFLGGPVALPYSRLDAADRDAAQREYLDSISEHATGDGYRVPGQFVIASARLSR
jgi:ubiquinone/menaquinone biosynthesis C-methylase UbiE